MNWLQQIGRGVGRLLSFLWDLWRWLFAWLANRRRQMARRRWPDYVVFTLEGEIPERTPVQPRLYSLLPFVQRPISIESLSAALRTVAADPDVQGVLFLLKGARFSLAQAQSLSALFARFRQWDRTHNDAHPLFRPKQIVVYLEQLGNATYAMAAATDRIVMPPVADWTVLGLHAEPTFLADTLAKAGIQFDVVKVAPWKTAYDRLSRGIISPADQEQTAWLLDSWYADLTAAIADGRSLPADQVRDLIDSAPVTAARARAAGLIDDVAYEDQLPLILGSGAGDQDQAKKGARLLPFAQAKRYLLRRPGKRPPGTIGVLTISGLIVPGKSHRLPIPLPLLGERTAGSSTVQQQVRAAIENRRLAAVVLLVDSRGGSALASDLMWRELSLLASKKPLIVYMGDVAASGGYYVATPAQVVVAQPATLTGSIGVVIGKPVTRDAYARLDAHRHSFRRGENADLYSDQTAWTGAQRERIETQVEHFYRIFKERVAQGRNLPYDELDAICSGKVWTGRQAVEKGLVDRLGDFAVAVEEACRLADLPTDGSVALVPVQADRFRMPAIMEQGEQAVSLPDIAGAVLRQDWERLLGTERIWLWADGLPRTH